MEILNRFVIHHYQRTFFQENDLNETLEDFLFFPVFVCCIMCCNYQIFSENILCYFFHSYFKLIFARQVVVVKLRSNNKTCGIRFFISIFVAFSLKTALVTILVKSGILVSVSAVIVFIKVVLVAKLVISELFFIFCSFCIESISGHLTGYTRYLVFNLCNF